MEEGLLFFKIKWFERVCCFKQKPLINELIQKLEDKKLFYKKNNVTIACVVKNNNNW